MVERTTHSLVHVVFSEATQLLAMMARIHLRRLFPAPTRKMLVPAVDATTLISFLACMLRATVALDKIVVVHLLRGDGAAAKTMIPTTANTQ
jgi:hypothetical protein